VGTVEIASLGHLPNHQQGPDVEIPRLERFETWGASKEPANSEFQILLQVAIKISHKRARHAATAAMNDVMAITCVGDDMGFGRQFHVRW
jgi:hypothetical protein